MIPLIDISSEKKLTDKIKNTIFSVVDSKNYILGKELESFEKKFAEFIGADDAIGVASGTDALRLALRAFGIGQGDKVLTVGFTSPFTSIAIAQEGAIPLYCDINDETLTMDISTIKGNLDSKIKAVMPVHIYGNPCNMKAILEFARRHKLIVVEDACQAVGASIGSAMAGTLGDVAAFSFYPTKNLGAMGDGGMVTTNNAGAARMIRLIRNGGQTKRFWHEYLGINSRLDEMQAAILEDKLLFLKAYNKRRAVLAKKYIDKLGDLPLKFQRVENGVTSSWHLFVIITPKRDKLKDFLMQKNIMSDIYYPYPVYKQKAFAGFPRFETLVTDRLCKEILAIPLYPLLESRDQDYIIKSIREFFGK